MISPGNCNMEITVVLRTEIWYGIIARRCSLDRINDISPAMEGSCNDNVSVYQTARISRRRGEGGREKINGRRHGGGGEGEGGRSHSHGLRERAARLHRRKYDSALHFLILPFRSASRTPWVSTSHLAHRYSPFRRAACVSARCISALPTAT